MAKKTPYDCPDSFRDFAFMPRFDDEINNLAALAEPEDWNYKSTFCPHDKPILRNYLVHTYSRIAEEKKITVASDEETAAWNTGLITTRQEPIFILFRKNLLPDVDCYWHFWRFCRKGENDLCRFSSLPEMAHYFDDPSVLIFDTRKELRVNVEHIIEENQVRFPQQLQTMNGFGLQNLVKGAIDTASERVKRNYKTAVPQYYQRSMQLLLPISLLAPDKADLALVVERYTDFYRGSTCLTLDMAYNNARQLARPDRDWLAP